VKYNLVYTRRAVKDIQKLQPGIKKRIGAKLLQYQSSPLKYAEVMSDSALGTYRFRVGDYRVIFDIEGNDVVVLRVGHRKEIYRRA